MKKLLRYHFATNNEYSAYITNQQIVLRCTPRIDEGQTLLQSTLELEPSIPLYALTDGFGNEMYSVSINVPHMCLHYVASGIAEIKTEKPAVPPLPLYSMPGELTKPGAGLHKWFASLSLQGLSSAQVAECICNVVHERIAYWPGVTDINTTAEQALSWGVGVCQDLTHIFAALARLAGLPVRYCTGITIGEGSTHAWPEVYYDGAWHGWDPTRKAACDAGYLRISVGRDAADCPVERGVFSGCCTQLQTVFMQVDEIAPDKLSEYMDNKEK